MKSYNMVETFDIFLRDFQHLNYSNNNHYQFTHSSFIDVRVFNLNYGVIKNIPKTINNLIETNTLHLNHNKLKYLNVLNLIDLIYINVNSNKIKMLSMKIKKLSEFKYRLNPLRNIKMFI